MVRQTHSTIISVLEQLHTLVKNNGSAFLIQEIEEEVKKLNEGKFYLVVVGQFKRGKSSLINALLGEPILPVGAVPLTATITLIQYGKEKKAYVTFTNGTKTPISIAELQQFITETHNPKNEKKVHLVEIFFPAEILHNGMVLVDTPGIGSIFEHNSTTTDRFIPKIDAAIVVLSPDPPITKIEQDFLIRTINEVKKVFIAFTKIDTIHPHTYEEIITFTQRVLTQLVKPSPLVIFPLSGFKGLEAKQKHDHTLLMQSGIPQLEQAIYTFAQHEKDDILLERSVQRTRALIDKARFATDLELNAKQMPISELEQKIAEFEKQCSTVLKEREHFSYLMQGEIASLQEQINNDVADFSRHETDVLFDYLQQKNINFSRIQNVQSLNSLEAELMEKMISDFDQWREQYEPTVRSRYEHIIAAYTVRTNNHIIAIEQLSHSLFNSQLSKFSRIEPLTWQQRFYYKVDDDPLFLETNLRWLLYRLFSSDKRKEIVQRKIRRDVERKVQRTGANLSYEYSYSIQEAFRSFHYELQTRLTTIIDTINTILHKAIEQKKQTETSLHSSIAQLQEQLSHLSSLQQRLEETIE